MTKQATVEKIETEFQERIAEEELLNCMRCGFCLPACPTYIETQDEVHSPRGRISLMLAVRNGEIDTMDEMQEVEHSLDVCLGCRACEPACPAGVNYGEMLEESRAILNEQNEPGIKEKGIRKMTLEGLFKNPKQMQQATSLLGFYQRSGLQKTTRKLSVMRFFPEHMAQMERVLPTPTKKKDRMHAAKFPSQTSEVKATVAMFKGCLMDTLFHETNRSTIELLTLAGCDVVVPNSQNCCGALHGHSGEKSGAIDLAKENITAFEKTGADYIITNAGGCGAFLHDYGHLLSGDIDWRERAEEFSSQIVDFSSVLIEVGFLEEVELKLGNQIVTYQDSCHLRNVLGVADAPRELIQSMDGVSYVEMKGAEQCCGSAGIYNLTQPEMSMQILDHKMEHVNATAAHTIVTTNPGCLLQMKLGIEREGQSENVRAVHLADLLLEAVE
ncbi:(Fe-S)-binding protein [Halalkalibacillus halophilus]|uniref:(Fe-S)-binding protein n=1 Tax=Halalkalibacillus halophilus TaxID=392827 RepID=UPI000417F2DF|nr:(Fe-S)-binding protein [Halalkalibacillus halophilus]